MWTVDVKFIEDWLYSLSDQDYQQVYATLEVLEETGPALGRPLVDTVKHSKHKNMKELRPGSSGGSELRLLFAFDPQRRAIFLVAGDKAGNWNKWYLKNIKLADQILSQHLEELKKHDNS